MVARDALRASPATKRIRPAFTWESSGSLRAMSAAMRLQSSVTLGRRVLMCGPARPRNRTTARYTARVTGERKYWVRTERGRVWGPFTVTALERLRGQLSDKCEASVDGQEWLPGPDFPELRDLLAPAKKIERRATDTPAGVTPVEPAPAAAKPAPPEAAAPKPKPRPLIPDRPPPPEPAPVAALEVPESGDLDQLSPAHLYALAAVTSSTGILELQPEKGGPLRIGFRRGTPEHFATDDPDLSLTRFLVSRGALAAEKAHAVEAFAKKAGQDLVAVLF